ncbi:MAG: caspase family protein [Clostridia bacterium]|nr:caspase family protein [Clostridia bacterium]
MRRLLAGLLVAALALCGAAWAETAAPSGAEIRYRALLIGEQTYESDDVGDRAGAIHTAQGMADMLNQLSMDYDVQLETDIGAARALQAISEAFSGAQPSDVSLFYINCHGYYQNGVCWVLFSDGSTLTPGDLESALRQVPGTVVVIVDACNSGGFIGEDARDFAQGFTDEFSGEALASGLRMSKYKVICSSGLEQQSYRLGFDGAADGDNIGTVLARSLCEGAGWDFIGDKRSAMRADADFDGTVTLADMAVFLKQRVRWYLDQTGGDYEQTVQVYPENDGFVLFQRDQ